MTNQVSRDNVFDDNEQFSVPAWQDYGSKIKAQTSWTTKDLEQEKGTLGSRKNQLTGILTNLFLEDFEDNDDDEPVLVPGKDKNVERENVSSAVRKILLSSSENNYDAIRNDLKKKSRRDLRVSFKERVHLISPDLREPPTTAELKSREDEAARRNSSLPHLGKSTEFSKPAKQDKRKVFGGSSSAKAKSSDFNDCVYGTSVTRGGSNSLRGLQRFLSKLSLAQCSDLDSAVIEIVRECNDPCRGVYGETIDLYY